MDKEFGTGAVKITPAHDHNDYECGQRQGLPMVQMMNDEGLITDVCSQFAVSFLPFFLSFLSFFLSFFSFFLS